MNRALHVGLRRVAALMLMSPLAAPDSTAQEAGWSLDDLFFLLRARDEALADLAIPFEVSYSPNEDCDYREIGWWYRSGERCGVYMQAGCLQRLPGTCWTAWDGARTREASGRGEWSDEARSLEPPPESELVRMNVMRTPFGGRLSEPVLPGEFGLNVINNPWSEYLQGMGKVAIRGERSVHGRACVEVEFDMSTEAKPDEFGLPWLVCFDKETLLAVRLECFEPLEGGMHEYAKLGLEGAPESVSIGGKGWVGTRLTEVLEHAEVAPGAFMATAGKFRQGPAWAGMEIRMTADAGAVVRDRAVIDRMLDVRARADAAVQDETLMPAGDASNSTATDVRESEDLATLLIALGQPAPEQRVEPFSESFFDASALYFVHRMEQGTSSLEDVVHAFPVRDRVRKAPLLESTASAAESLGLHARFLSEPPPEGLPKDVWMLTRLASHGNDTIVGAAVARVEGERVRVVGEGWSTESLELKRFVDSLDGPLLLVSKQECAEPTAVAWRPILMGMGFLCLAVGVASTVRNARRVGAAEVVESERPPA